MNSSAKNNEIKLGSYSDSLNKFKTIYPKRYAVVGLRHIPLKIEFPQLLVDEIH
jgi:hypothetical protein